MRLTAREIYDKLINEDRITELEGQIKFYLGDVSIIVKQRDVVGNIMQEWLHGWLDNNDIEYAPSENTQMPPDFFLNPDDRTVNLLEVKAFNRSGTPGFDIADFRMYQSEIIEKPYMLDVEYLVFGYDMSDDGIVTIKDVWLKKVWEITRRMEEWPIKMLHGSFDYCDIVDNANIMKEKSIILVGEPFLLDDDLRNNAIKWVERANSSDTACLDIV